MPEAVSFVTFLIDVSLKSAMLAAVAGLVAFLLRRRSASVQSLIWTLALAAVLLLPPAAILTPDLKLPLIPALDSWLPDGREELARIFDKQADAEYSEPAPSAATAGPTAESTSPSSGTAAWFSIPELHWTTWLAVAWAAGAVFFLLRLLIGRVILFWIQRKAEPLDDENIVKLLHTLLAESEIDRSIRLLRSDLIGVAFANGITATSLVLPSAADDWDEDRLRVVMLHELAHVKRGDLLFELLAQLVTAFYWFNPLVWIMAHRFRVERERACDDSVINAGVKQSDYASQLLLVARDLEEQRRPIWQAAAISQGAGLKNRLLCILSPKRQRTTHNGPAAILIGLAIVIIALPLAAISPWQLSSTEKVVAQPGGGRLLSLIQDLRSPNPSVRKQAVWTLGKMDDERAGLALRQALNDADVVVRTSAYRSLAERGDEYSIPVFVKSLLDRDYRIRAAAAKAIITCANAKNSQTRLKTYKTLEEQSGSSDKMFVLLVDALQKCERKECIIAAEQLVKSLLDLGMPKLGQLALTALAAAGDPNFASAFCLVIYKDGSEVNRGMAIEILVKLNFLDADIHDALQYALFKDGSLKIRSSAARAIGALGDLKAYEALLKASNDPDSRVRKEAEISLKRLEQLKIKLSRNSVR
jgi:beta-lactamase regulating signal transducer with metallopeptidase domain